MKKLESNIEKYRKLSKDKLVSKLSEKNQDIRFLKGSLQLMSIRMEKLELVLKDIAEVARVQNIKIECIDEELYTRVIKSLYNI